MIDGKPSGLAGPFTRCLPGGCFAGIEIRDTIIYQFRTATAPAQIVYASAENRQVVIPLSFKGFAEALDVLQKQ
jgi:invasion protein IalB